MIVALDVGNTNLRLGIVSEGEVTVSRRTLTPRTATAGEVETVLDGLLAESNASLGARDAIVLVSVVPAVTAAIAELSLRRGIRLLVADHTTVPLPIRVEDPATVGNDRLVNALAGSRLYGAPAIIVDLGTATTFDVVAADGAFVGGAIAPGVGLGLQQLTERTAQLPTIVLAMPPRAIGRNTVEAMQSGAVLGYVGLVGHLVRAISAELAIDGGTAPKVILTGGLSAHPWANALPSVEAIDPLLTLRGLAILHAEIGRSATVRA